MTKDDVTPIANPIVVLREEFDDWAILFDPDTAEAYGLNPVSVFIWKRLDGRNTFADIVRALQEVCEDVPGDALEHIRVFTEELVSRGLAGREVT
jgi:SynChlorMet cassette protein ScmD